MIKKEFLKEFSKKLEILEENEKKDILNEYSDIIDEKVKNGQSEIEAINDFGNIDELAQGILSAYKINPDYGKKKETKASDVANKFEDFIKSAASAMADFFRYASEEIKKNDGEFSLESIFELLLKAFMLVIICALLLIPFSIVKGLMFEVFAFMGFPIGTLFKAFGYVIISLVYILVCFIIGLGLFKKNIKIKTEHSSNTNRETSKKKVNNNKVAKEVKEEKIEDIKVKETRQIKASILFMDILKSFLQVIGVFIIIPFIFVNIVFGASIGYLIFLMFKQIFLYDILIMLIGLLIVFSTIQNCVYNAFISHKKIYLYPIILGMALMLVSSFIMFDRLGRSEYNIDPINKYEIISEAKDFLLIDSTIIDHSNLYGDYEVVMDNKIEAGKMQITSSYYRDVSDVNIYKITKNDKDYYYINNYDNDFKTNYNLFMEMIKNFSENRNYNYDEIKKAKIVVHINPNDQNKINFGKSE